MKLFFMQQPYTNLLRGKAARNRLLRVANRRDPGAVARILAPTGREIGLLQLHSKRPWLAAAHGPAVYAADRRNLHARAAQKDFVAGIQFGAVDAPLLHLHTEILFDHRYQGVARNALKDILGERGRSEFAVAQ